MDADALRAVHSVQLSGLRIQEWTKRSTPRWCGGRDGGGCRQITPNSRRGYRCDAAAQYRQGCSPCETRHGLRGGPVGWGLSSRGSEAVPVGWGLSSRGSEAGPVGWGLSPRGSEAVPWVGSLPRGSEAVPWGGVSPRGAVRWVPWGGVSPLGAVRRFPWGGVSPLWAEAVPWGGVSPLGAVRRFPWGGVSSLGAAAVPWGGDSPLGAVLGIPAACLSTRRLTGRAAPIDFERPQRFNSTATSMSLLQGRVQDWAEAHTLPRRGGSRRPCPPSQGREKALAQTSDFGGGEARPRSWTVKLCSQRRMDRPSCHRLCVFTFSSA